MPLARYWEIIRERRRIVLLAFFTTVLTTTLGSFLWPATYEGVATIMLDYDSSNPMNVAAVPYMMSPTSVEYVNTQIEIIRSRRIAEGVVDLLGLDKAPDVIEKFNEAKAGNPLFFWREPKELDIRVWLADNFLARFLKVEPARDSRFITIKFHSSDPNFSALVANAFAKSYAGYNLELKVMPYRDASRWFSDKLKDVKGQSDKATEQLREYQKEKGIIAAPQGGQIYDDAVQRLDQINRELAGAKAKLYESQVALKRVEESRGSYEALPEVIANTFIANLKVEKVKLETQLTELSSKLGSRHPQYKRVNGEFQTVTTRIQAEMQNIVQAIRQDAASAAQRVHGLEAAVAGLKQNVLTTNLARSEMESLSRESEATRQAYDVVLKKFNESAIQGDINRTNIFIIDAAVPPQNKYSPKILLNILLSIFVGLFLGIGLAFLFDVLDASIKNSDELERLLGVPVLGSVTTRKEAA